MSHIEDRRERGGLVVESDSGGRGRGFDTYLRRIVSLSKDTFTSHTQEAVAPCRYDCKIVDWDVKHQHKQINKHRF